MEIVTNTAAEATPVEAPQSPPPSIPEPQLEVVKPDSKALLDIAKREAEWAKREVSRKEEAAKLQNELKTLQEKLQGIEKIKENYRADPEAALAKLGLTYEELTDAIIEYEQKKAPPTEEDIIQQKVNKTLAEREEALRKEELARIEQEEAETLQFFQGEIEKFIETAGSQYPLLTKLYGSIGGAESPNAIIYGAIEAHFNETNEILKFEDVARVAEEWFREEWTRLQQEIEPKSTPKVAEAPAPTTATPSPEPVVETNLENWKPFSFMDVQEKDLETPQTLRQKLNNPRKREYFDPKHEVRRNAIAEAVNILETYGKKGV